MRPSRRLSLVLGVLGTSVLVVVLVVMIDRARDDEPATVANDGSHHVVRIVDEVAWALRGSRVAITDLRRGPERRPVRLRGRVFRVVCRAEDRAGSQVGDRASGTLRFPPYDRPVEVRLDRAIPRVTTCALQAAAGAADVTRVRFVERRRKRMVVIR